MKTALTYGFVMALASALVTLGFFFGGFHETAEKLQSTQWLGLVLGLAVTIVGLTLAMREKRSLADPEGNWSYGSAFGIGVLTSLFASLFGMVFAYVYFAVLNPGLGDVMVQAQLQAMEAKGMAGAQLDQAEPMLRKWMSPLVLTLSQGFGGFMMALVLSLILAIFHRRPAGSLEAKLPPTLG